MEFKKVVFLTLFVSLLTIFWYYQSIEQTKSAEIIFKKNSIDFTGRIISYNKSTNHAFGLIKFKVIKSSKETFNISDPKLLYPYRLEKGYGEFYSYLPLGIKVGQIIVVKAGNKIAELYDGKDKIMKTDVFIIAERKFIEYVNEYTSFTDNVRAKKVN